jgi:hypothetical protein
LTEHLEENGFEKLSSASSVSESTANEVVKSIISAHQHEMVKLENQMKTDADEIAKLRREN